MCISGVVGCLLFLLGVAWWLSQQHYQPLLTQYLSALVGAEVQVASSAVSFRHGLGIGLEQVVVQNPSEAVPFFTTEHVDVLLDLNAVLRGQLVFQHIHCVSPRIQLEAGEGTISAPPLVSRVLQGQAAAESGGQVEQAWFSPTFALHHLVLQGGQVRYTNRQEQEDIGLILTETDMDLTLNEDDGVSVRFQTALGADGEMGQLALQARALAWQPDTVFSQIEWQGTVEFHNLLVDQLGRWLSKEWPQARLNFSGDWTGKGTEQLELTGEADVRELQVGNVRVRQAKTTLTKLVWQEPDQISVQAELADVRGEIGAEFLPIELYTGSLSLDQGEVTITGISGTYGSSSTITEVQGTLQHLFSARGAVLDINLAASLDLEEGLGKFLASQIGTEMARFSQRYLTRPRGQALVRLAMQGPLDALGYSGEAVFQATQAQLPAWDLDVSELVGTVRLRDSTFTADALRFQVGQSAIHIQGSITDALSAQRSADLRVEAVVDLEEGLTPLLAVLPDTELTGLTELAQHVRHPYGRAQVQLQLQGKPVSLMYNGEVRFEQVAFHLPRWHMDVSGLAGTVQLDPARLATDGLLVQIGESSFQVHGRVHDYRSPRRSAELHVAVLKASDRDVVQFLPPGKMLARGGSLTGHVDASLKADSQQLDTTGELRLNQIVLDLVSFLQPLEVLDGQLAWHGQGGTFTLSQARLAGSALTGQGRFRSIDPPHIELEAHVADLDLDAALALDTPQEEDKESAESKETDSVIQVNLTTDRVGYKSLRAENLRLACHWHERQADLTLAGANIAGGHVEGRAVLWPDRQSVFLSPELTDVDASRFLQALGQSPNVLTGSLTGNGQIRIPDWHKWENVADWDASLSLAVRDGVVQQLPVLVRMWSVVSLQGLLSFELPRLSTGLAFSALRGDLTIDKGILRTDNLVLSSSAIRFDTSGSIDLAPRRLNLTTALVPLHGITSSVAKVPLAGKLLARGADRLTTLPFHVTGVMGDPVVTPLWVSLR